MASISGRQRTSPDLQKLNLELKRVFDLEGIQFAFPTQTVHFKPDLR